MGHHLSGSFAQGKVLVMNTNNSTMDDTAAELDADIAVITAMSGATKEK